MDWKTGRKNLAKLKLNVSISGNEWLAYYVDAESGSEVSDKLIEMRYKNRL